MDVVHKTNMSICCVSYPVGHATDLSSCGGKVTCVWLSCRMLSCILAYFSSLNPPPSSLLAPQKITFSFLSTFKQRDKNNSNERTASSFLEPPQHHGDILFLPLPHPSFLSLHLSICLPWPASFSFLLSSPLLFLYLRSTVRSIRLMKGPAHSSRLCPASHLISNLAAPVIHHSAPSVCVCAPTACLCVNAAESRPKRWTTKVNSYF